MSRQRILVPTDFTSAGNKAFQIASEFISIKSGIVTPLFIYEGNRYENILPELSPGKLTPELIGRISEKVHAAAIAHIPEEFVAEPMVLTTQIAPGIVKASENFDLVIMGTNERTGLQRIMHSSVVKKIISVCPRPVLVITEKSSLLPPERVLILTDASEDSTRVFMGARHFLENTDVKADLVYFVQSGPFVVGSNNSNLKKAQKDLTSLKRRFFRGMEDRIKEEVLITSVSPSEAITNLTLSRNYNMLFMTTMGQSKLSNLMLGSTAATIIRTVNCAAYVVNPKEYSI